MSDMNEERSDKGGIILVVVEMKGMSIEYALLPFSKRRPLTTTMNDAHGCHFFPSSDSGMTHHLRHIKGCRFRGGYPAWADTTGLDRLS